MPKDPPVTYLISSGGKESRTSHGRNGANDALQFAYALDRMGEAKIKVTDCETGEAYTIAQFERLIQGVKAG